MHRHVNTISCIRCNAPRIPRQVTIHNSSKNLCTSETCLREVFSSETVLPEEIEKNSLFLEYYKSNFRSIGQGLDVLGCVQAIYNVRLTTFESDQGVSEIVTALRAIHENQLYSYRVAVSFGRILTCTEDAEQRVMYFHASANNSSVFYDSEDHQDPYFLVKNSESFESCIDLLKSKVKVDTSRPDTKWTVVGNVNVNLTYIRPTNVFLGKLESVPPSFRKRGMLHFHRDSYSKRVYRDNLCFFRCLSHHLYKTLDRTVELFKEAYPDTCQKKFKGILLSDLDRLEKVFKIDIRVFKLSSTNKVTVVRSKLCSSKKVLNLNMYRNHLSLIVDMCKYGRVYSCEKCYKAFSSNYNLKRHTAVTKDCTKVRFIYKGGVYKPSRTIFQKLSELGVHTPAHLKIYPYKIAFDFESYFVKNGEKSCNTTFELDHVPLSASVASDFPGYTEPVCFVRESNRENDDLVSRVLGYIDMLACEIGECVRERFKVVTDQLDALQAEEERLESAALKAAKLEKSKYNLSPVVRAKQALTAYMNRVPVVGFNSGRYDLNLIKRSFHTFFSEREKKPMTTIKRCNQYIAVYTEHLVFLDMVNYLAPGYNYASYLKAFLKDTEKGFFPYEWMDNVRKLDNTTLPPRRSFYSSLTGKGITQAEYRSCKEVWVKEKMKTMKDYLVYYNNLDVAPFVRAINEHSKFFIERSVDMFKDGLTLPGLTLKFLFQNTELNATPYVLFSHHEKEVHNLLRKNLVGGPAIIFHRHHRSGITRIRERKYGVESKKCDHILGVDANSLYLKCMGEAHCTGFYVVRRHEDDFKPVLSQQISYSAVEWPRYRAIVDKVPILHQYNYGEVSVGSQRIRVDGIVPDRKLIYQFHGCYWHGHTCQINKTLMTSTKGREWIEERSSKTAAVTLYLKSLGYTVVEQYECQWIKLRKNTQCLKLIPEWSVNRPSSAGKMSQAEIIEGVKSGSVFGLIQVDIHTPEHLKPYFAEMTPVFKNILVSKEDVGDHMKTYLESVGKLRQPQRQLIGSFHGSGLLLGTPLLKWYLEKGLVVSKVHLLVQYTPEETFRPFVQEVTAARRKGDENVDCKILSDLYKLLGNSSYGKTICNKQNFLNTKYVSPDFASRHCLHWSVQQVHDISENTVEMSSLPTSITYDLPVQIGFMVYQYAKLKMLAFYYDFLLKFIDSKDFEMCEMDTDSFYFALSKKNLDEAVKPEMREQYFRERHKWLPSESCDNPQHRETYIQCRTHNYPWVQPPFCYRRLVFDKRTPGLFKIEWEGDAMTSLNPKCYMCVSETGNKTSCKGVIQRQNNLTETNYQNVLKTEKTHVVTNRGFRVIDHHVTTYSQNKQDLNYQYIKRIVCEDGVSTEPLDI